MELDQKKRKDALMNKTLTIIVAIMLTMLLACSALGQEVTQGLTGKGVKVGINLAKLTGDDAEGLKTKVGIVGGAFITYSFSPTIAIQPELLYSMKGSKWDTTETFSREGVDVSYSESIKGKLTYLQIPILLKVTVPTSGNIKPSFFAGPALGILLSAKSKSEWSITGQVEGVSIDSSESSEDDIKDNVKSTDFSLVFGGGAGYVVGSGMITLDARFDLGLSSIAKKQEGEDKAEKIKTSTISLMVGYSF